MNGRSLAATSSSMRRVALSTGVSLDVALLGDPAAPPVILLHGFPESHRMWRHQMLGLAIRNYVIAPDQRGYCGSSRPVEIEAYRPRRLMHDVLALADALEVERFTLVGHDWGGAIAWSAATRYPRRVRRLATINAPHPLLLQRALIDDPEQRKASQFIRTFRETAADGDPTREQLEEFYDQLFVHHLGVHASPEERARYLAQWSEPGAMQAMLHWYRASDLIVPAVDEEVERPAWIDGPFPLVSQPTLAIWGMRDAGLRPSLLHGLDSLVANLKVVRIPDAGHFPAWETPAEVTLALSSWLDRTPFEPVNW